MTAKPVVVAALAALLVPLGADGHTSHISLTALVSASAGTVSASPAVFFLAQGAVPRALGVALSGMPSAHQPYAGEAARSVRRFTSGSDGALPEANLVDVNGVLYGTTVGGGKYSQGTVFAVNPATGQERVLYSFTGGTDGANPAARLIEVSGVLYGTTEYGGQHGRGTVFELDATGQERVLHSFGSGTDGEGPSDLIEVKGVLYGTTYGGGQNGLGTVFGVNTTGQERVLHSFARGTDGALPAGGLVDVNGVLYGTTAIGGKYGERNVGLGTVFAVTTTGQERVLHSFGSGTDGANPSHDLIDVNGVLYGTTSYGGQYGEQTGGLGTVFAVATTGQERVLHSFGSEKDGKDPQAGLIDVNGVLYGTTSNGGQYRFGTVFAVTATGQERVVHSFGSGTDGEVPLAGLIDVNGGLFGTTLYGGQAGERGVGTVFTVTPSGQERVLHSFGG